MFNYDKYGNYDIFLVLPKENIQNYIFFDVLLAAKKKLVDEPKYT